MQVLHFIAAWVVFVTAAPALAFQREHGFFSASHVAMAFFCGLNLLVCLWEICLGMRI